MIKTNLFIGSRFPVNRKKLRQTVEKLMAEQGIDNIQVDVTVVGGRKMTELNEQKMKHKGVTDVLSFPQHEKKDKVNEFPLPDGEPPHLGDIVICFPVAVKNAKRFGKMVDDQICFYLEHGLMHLLGYHHD